jgi:hypothetical protein
MLNYMALALAHPTTRSPRVSNKIIYHDSA